MTDNITETINTDAVYRYRQLACIVMEAAAPIAVGSGEKSIMTDAAVARDANGLPYIPGSSLAGIIRHAMKSHTDRKKWMGCQEGLKVMGSRLAVTEAKILDSNGKPADGLLPDAAEDPLLCHFMANRLPIRQHVRISHFGTAKDMGKFDEEVVPKGTCFCFELELLADEDKESGRIMDDILRSIAADTFRIGSGTRSGFGAMEIVSIGRRKIDLMIKDDRDAYLKKSSMLNPDWDGFMQIDPKQLKSTDDGFIRYTLTLKPADFMFFGSGFGSDDADMTYVRNPAVLWSPDGRKGTFSDAAEEKFILIPASSVKGALSHRIAYYYNQLTGVFADDRKMFPEISPDELKELLSKHTGDRNHAVKTLFGSAGDNGDEKARGLTIFTDVTAKNTAGAKSKILNHVSVDRFTGGAINGALFKEETFFARGTEFETTILVSEDAVANDKEKDKVLKAFEYALTDICNGLLPLGGGVNRGNGTFKGSWKKE